MQFWLDYRYQRHRVFGMRKGLLSDHRRQLSRLVPALSLNLVLANDSFSQSASLDAPSVPMERGLVSPANLALPKTPTTKRNASLSTPSHHPEPPVLPEVSAAVLLVARVLRHVQRVLGQHLTTVLSALLAPTSSMGVASAPMQMAFVPVPI